MVVVLPAPLGPRKPRISTLHAEADVVHSGDGAVTFAEVLNLDHVYLSSSCLAWD